MNAQDTSDFSSNVLRCFTDGAAKANSKNASAGWAFYIPKLNIRKSGHMIGTNNQAELTAVKELLTYIISSLDTSQFKESPHSELMIFSDSQYTIHILTGGKATANKDLINSIFELGRVLLQKFSILKFKYVEAHTNGTDWVSKCNAVVDRLASDAAKNIEHNSDRTSERPKYPENKSPFTASVKKTPAKKSSRPKKKPVK